MKSKDFEYTYNRVFHSAKRALNKLSMTIEEVDEKRGTIKASTKTSFFGWGEDVSLIFKDLGNKTSVVVQSSSPSQIITWGKNEVNEDQVLEGIYRDLKGL